ncbi:hypothetical protein DIPPA_22017 [Diplonema papillatum]|nr:hypothetical protein DIPPA_22017 [Diplonema papillatum]
MASTLLESLQNDQQVFSDEQLEKAFYEMSSGKPELAAPDLVKFYYAVGEDVAEEEADQVIRALSTDPERMYLIPTDFKKVRRPRTSTAV